MKKIFPGDRQHKKSVVEFFDRKGFYIILIVLIVIVGTTAVILSTQNINPMVPGPEAEDYIPDKIIPDDEVAEGEAEGTESSINDSTDKDTKAASGITGTDTVKDVPPEDTGTAKSASDTTTAANTGAKKSTAPKPTPTPEAKPQTFIMPVFGQVSLEYAMNRLIYSKTLEEWRTHSGIDIACEKGSPVKVVADGVVIEVKNDPRFGITVIVEHPGAIRSIYCNLASDDVVVPNQKVKQGEIIGSVGSSAMFEIAEEPHLHFEVMKNETIEDPALYLPKS